MWLAMQNFQKENRTLIDLIRRLRFVYYYFQCSKSFRFGQADELCRDSLFVFLKKIKDPGNSVVVIRLKEIIGEIQFNYLFSAAEWLWDEWEDLACSYAHNKEQSFNTFKALNVHDLKNTIELIDGWLMASAMIYFPEKRKWAEIDEIVRAIIR